MKGIILFLFLLLFCSITAMSTTYQVGSDATYHQYSELPTLVPGDIVQFKKGEKFNPFIIGQSGSVGNLITITSYGTGANPIITGFATVAAWTNLGSNIWESTNTVSSLSSCNIVTIGGVNIPMGRTPNLDNYYTLNRVTYVVNSVSDYSGTVANTVLITTNTAHNIQTGQTVQLALSGVDYDNTYIATRVSGTQFYVTATYTTTATGTVYNNYEITSPSLTGTPNWGSPQATIVVRTSNWVWENSVVANQTGSIITYTEVYPTSAFGFTPTDGWGFFIQNDVRTLDAQNEWYFNPTTDKIRIYSTSQPTNVKIASNEYCISATSKDYITIENLTIEGANTTGILIEGTVGSRSDHIVISGCTVNKCGLDGIRFKAYTDYYTANNNTVKNCNYVGINGVGDSFTNTEETITNNTLDSCGMVIGIGRQYSPASIMSATDISIIQYNRIDHSGYNGIMTSGDHAQIRNNFVNNSLLNRADGGGIYNAGADVAKVIDHNIVLNGYGHTGATTMTAHMAHGIYLDINSSNITVSNNTCSGNGGWGIILNEGSDLNTISNNTSYNNTLSQLNIQNLSGASGVINNTASGNLWIAKESTQLVAKFQSYLNDITGFMTSDNNYYCRPIADNTVTVSYYQPNLSGGLGTFAQWKTFSGQDANSHQSSKTITTTDDLFFAYNATSSPIVVNLPHTGIDVKNVRYGSTATLPAWGSLVLIKDLTNPLPTPGQKPANVGNGKIGIDSNGNPLYTN